MTAQSSKCSSKHACLKIKSVALELPFIRSAASMVQRGKRCHDWNRLRQSGRDNAKGGPRVPRDRTTSFIETDQKGSSQSLQVNR